MDSLKEQYQQQLKVKNLTNSEIQDLQQKLSSIESDLVTEKAFSAGLTKQRDKLQEDYTDMKKKFMKLQREKNTFAKNMQLELDKYREQRDKFEKELESTSKSLQTYKDSMDALVKKHKMDEENEFKKLQDANTQIQDLQKKLENNEISLDSYKKKLQESENQFKLAKKRYKDSFSTKENKVVELLKEKDELQKNNEILNKDIIHFKSRITAKDEEIQGYLKEINNKREEIKKISSDLSKKDFYADQFNKEKIKYDGLMKDHKDLVHKANQTKKDRDELEVELERLQKEIDSTKKEMKDLKKKMIDPKLLEESRQHVKELSEQLNQKEKELKQKVDEWKDIVKEVENTKDIINKQKEEYELKLEKQKTEYEKKLERQKEPLTPQELKAIGNNALEEMDKETFKDTNYEQLLEKLRARKEKYREIAENNRVKPNKRYFYDKLEKSMDYRIDFMRIVIGETVDTNTGRDILERLRRANMGYLARFWDDMKRNKATIVQIIFGILQVIGSIIFVSLQWTANTIVKGGKDYVLPAVIQTGTAMGINSVKDLILAVPKFLLWAADHMTQFIIGAISVSIFLYQEYGEEASFPILAFWCYILAMGMFALHYVKSTYEKAKSYIPLTGGDHK